jgi:hypothetical protein
MIWCCLRNFCTKPLLLITVLSLAACTTKQISEKRYLILPKVGIAECSVGSDEACFSKTFGGMKKDSYWIAEDKGVEANTANGKIAVIFFYYHSKTHNSFSGETVEGVGIYSTFEDAIRIYGRPESISESVVSEFGTMPGAKEKHLHYGSKGLAITFLDGRLADIRTFPPK